MADLSPDFTDAEPPAEFSRTPDSGAVVNRLCAVLSEEYGWLRFSTRTGAAVQAIRFVEARRDGGPDLPTRVASLEEELVSARSETDRLRTELEQFRTSHREVVGGMAREVDRLRADDHFDWPCSNLRLPDDLHARLHTAAELERRSLNAEILHRLERSFLPCSDDKCAPIPPHG